MSSQYLTVIYALLGDPATRLRLPEKLDVSHRRTKEGWQFRGKIGAAAITVRE